MARLPVRHLYAPSHAWLASLTQAGAARWRVGLTKFATRMLGEIVEFQFTTKSGDPIQPGDILGSIEGFKALSDLYCVGRGVFVGANPVLATNPEVVERDPHEAGWLYSFDGEPGDGALGVAGYCQILDETIDRILAREKQEEQAP
ncbi:MAG: glycine cleavage system protein H [Limisphaerales bacterium]